jgi:hypothetical protein
MLYLISAKYLSNGSLKIRTFKMKLILFIPVILVVACKYREPKKVPATTDSSKLIVDTDQMVKNTKADSAMPIAKVYSNKRFKGVSVEHISEHKFRVRGKAQLFEANLSWVVEDGHEELKKGFQMTDAGAPEWGKFDFIIEVKKKRENSTLTLILFESSAKDGSRQYELPMPLF